MSTKIIINGECLDLPDDFQLSIIRNNPFFSETTSFSYPATIKNTPENQRKLGYPGIIDAETLNSFSGKSEILSGTHRLIGKIKLDDIDEQDISFNIDISEGDIFQQFSKTKMQELFNDPVYCLYSDTDNGWDKYFNLIVTEKIIYPNSDLTIFPVCTFIKDLPPYDQDTRVLNKIQFIQWDMQKRKYTTSFIRPGLNNIYNAVTPFLFINCVVNRIAQKHNFKIVRNDMDSYFNKFVVLNNFYNPIRKDYTGKYAINYRDLLPTCSISEFISSLENTFGCLFYFNQEFGELHIISRNEYLESPAQFDLTPFLRSKPYYKQHQPMNLILDANRNMQLAAVNERFKSDALKNFSTLKILPSDPMLPEDKKDCLYYRKFYKNYYTAKYIGEYNMEIESKALTSALFSNPVRNEEYENKEIKTEAELLTTVTFLSGDVSGFKFTYRTPLFSKDMRMYNDGEVSIENMTDECPIAFASPVFDVYDDSRQIVIPCGFTLNRDRESLFINFTFDNGEEGVKNLYTEFWQKTGDYFENSNVEIQITITLPTEILTQLQLFHKVQIVNQTFLIESWTENYTINGLSDVIFTLRTCRPLKP